MTKAASPNIKLLILAGIFGLIFFIPFFSFVMPGPLHEGLAMLQEYAHLHVLFCLVPAFFIAGAIMVFLNTRAVIAYLGPAANKLVAYSVASVSGSVLAVCSCTVLPIFKGIYKKGAGIGPAVSFLYSGPAINVLAIILTARVLGWKLGLARTVGAVVFAFVIGLIMSVIFGREDKKRVTDERMFRNTEDETGRSLGQNVLYLAVMIGILVFLNWTSSGGSLAAWDLLYTYKYVIVGILGIGLFIMLLAWFKKNELTHWLSSTRDFAVQILPLLFAGVLVAGFLLGRPGHTALIPPGWISGLVGGNSLLSNAAAAVSGALMYFATLTEVPILQGLIGAGMGQGPALALLLAGPSLSLPSILVIHGELGLKKTLVYVLLVIGLSTAAGVGYGMIAGG
jgi:uncharacterized membrane protein YraQ (UPF0718 family)